MYKGIDKSLIGWSNSSDEGQRYHGSDGLGDCPDDNPPSSDLLQKEHATIALLRLVNQHPGD